MNLRELNYNIDMDGISPGVEQFGGTQGDHRVTKLNFVFSDKFNQEIDELGAEGDRLMYRVDVYDGEGGIWQSEPKELIDNTISVELEERHTRFGGKITVYLVITALSQDNETQVELYSFPAVLRLKNRPEGEYQDGENYESISCLAETTKQKAAEAGAAVAAAENTKKELEEIAAAVEEKLKNGEFDGVGVQGAQIINDELIITYTDDTSQNLGNVKGEQGVKGEKGDKGDAGANGKDAVIDQIFNSRSENAQSGKAVGGQLAIFENRVQEALNYGIRVEHSLDSEYYTKTEIDRLDSVQNVRIFGVDNDTGLSITSPSGNQYIDLYDSSDMDINADGNNINVNDAKIVNVATPEDDTDAANKKYVDDVVSNLSGLKVIVASMLPDIGDIDTLYFVPTNNTSDQNLYDEYIYIDSAWEKIGSAAVEVDLADYVKKTDIANASTVGVVKVKDFYGVNVSSDGAIFGMVYDVDKYATRNESAIISKGTLDNVLAEKLGDIESLLGGI